MNINEELPYREWTHKSEADKAINSLKGILTGINLDGQVNDAEIAELLEWVKNHNELISRNPFNEFMQIILYMEQNRLHSVEGIEDLYWLCQKYENNNVYYNPMTADLQTLQGVCHGIIADGVINDEEIYALDKWLEEHMHLSTYYPYDELLSLITSILRDKIITDEERNRLKAYINEFVKLNDEQLHKSIQEDIKDIKISGICTSNPDISFDGTQFCFTGISKRGTREEIAKQIEELGGKFVNGLNLKTNYLIVGNSENPCWAFACYGRKIEKAMQLRKEGHTVTIIHEYDFWDFVEDAK